MTSATAVEPLGRPLTGTVGVPGDKSVSHRAAILAALARGRSEVRGYSPAGDCGATLGVLRALGVPIEEADGALRVDGRGPAGLSPPPGPLDCRRSGTTMRLMAGVLAGTGFRATLTGDPQLLRRPMERVAEPLRRMGASVDLSEGGRPPVTVGGGRLRGIRYRLPVASAQVKSAVLLAGLEAEGTTTVLEPVPSRDHTERLLAWLGAPFEAGREGDAAALSVRAARPEGFALEVPGDLSSAAPLLAAAALVPGSDLVVVGVGLNPTRTGFLRALERMGARLETEIAVREPEPAGTVRLRHAPLRGIVVEAPEVPLLIDELPLLGLVGTAAEGVTEVRGAGELRVKESDRVAGLVRGLRALGAEAEELPDGFVVRGPTPLRPGSCDSLGDHRLAMAFAVAGLAASGPVRVAGMGSVADSFPGFAEVLRGL